MCTAKNNVVYQAKFLPSVTNTALEIRNITQLWILTNPIIIIDEQVYEVDPYCPIIVNELGITSCGSTEALLPNEKPSLGLSVIELASISGVGAMLVLFIVLVIFLVLCCVMKKSKSHNVR